MNVLSGYAPKVGCEIEVNEKFWSILYELLENNLREERMVIGADFKFHIVETDRGDEEVLGRFGLKKMNMKGLIVVDFAKRIEMTVVNIYFQKRDEHRLA